MKISASGWSDLIGTVESQQAEMGVLITMGGLTRGMVETAKPAKNYTWSINGQVFPKVQTMTVPELLATFIGVALRVWAPAGSMRWRTVLKATPATCSPPVGEVGRRAVSDEASKTSPGCPRPGPLGVSVRALMRHVRCSS